MNDFIESFLENGEKMLIKDFTEKDIKIFESSTENELLRAREPEPGYFMAESPNVIERALNDGYIPEMALVDESVANSSLVQRLVEEYKTPVYLASPEHIKNVQGFEMTRGALCLMNRRACKSAEDVLRGVSRIAILEDVMNPTNLGAIFRSAASLGIEAIILTKGCSDPLYRRAARVSMGTVFQIPWARTEDVISLLSQLRNFGFVSLAMALDEKAVKLGDSSLEGHKKMAFVLGSEGYGLKKETIEACDYTVMIPMTNGVDSLNVAAASAVVFWEFFR